MIVTKDLQKEEALELINNLKSRDFVEFECNHCLTITKRLVKKVRHSLTYNKILYCCNSCAIESNVVRFDHPCGCCGNLTNNPRFCSRSCAAKVTNKETPKRVRTNKCLVCDSLAKDHRSKYCEIHNEEYKEKNKNKYRDATVGDYTTKLSVKGKHPSWLASHIRNFAKSWNKDLVGNCCEMCGYSKHTELAHIKSVSSFDLTTKLSVVNARDNILILCPNCHWEFDNLDRENFSHLLEENYLNSR